MAQVRARTPVGFLARQGMEVGGSMQTGNIEMGFGDEKGRVLALSAAAAERPGKWRSSRSWRGPVWLMRCALPAALGARVPLARK